MSHAESKTIALVIKSRPLKEGDLLLVLLTQAAGKITVLAKGVRKPNSKRRSYLESGNILKVHLVGKQQLPTLAQVELLSDTHEARFNLSTLKKLLLFLEIIDRLMVAEALPLPLFRQILKLREFCLHDFPNSKLREHFSEFLTTLGYQSSPKESICNQVGELLGQNLCSYAYLSL